MNAKRQILFVLAALVIVLGACKKAKKDTTPVGALGATFPYPVNNVVTPAILDTLKSHGTIIYDGLTPPQLGGIYLVHPNYCTFDNSGEDRKGDIFADYKYQFSNQNNTAFTLQIDFNSAAAQDSGNDGSATYISGSGNFFTIYALVTGVDEGVSYKALQIISGEMSSTGIKNFQLTHFLQSKTGDQTNSVLEPVNSTRLFIDQDGLSETQTSLNVIAPRSVKPVTNGNAANASTIGSAK